MRRSIGFLGRRCGVVGRGWERGKGGRIGLGRVRVGFLYDFFNREGDE